MGTLGAIPVVGLDAAASTAVVVKWVMLGPCGSSMLVELPLCLHPFSRVSPWQPHLFVTVDGGTRLGAGHDHCL